jgi:hypothetical protein
MHQQLQNLHAAAAEEQCIKDALTHSKDSPQTDCLDCSSSMPCACAVLLFCLQHIELHRKRYGQQLNHETKKRKREAREVHKRAEYAQKAIGLKVRVLVLGLWVGSAAAGPQLGCAAPVVWQFSTGQQQQAFGCMWQVWGSMVRQDGCGRMRMGPTIGFFVAAPAEMATRLHQGGRLLTFYLKAGLVGFSRALPKTPLPHT